MVSVVLPGINTTRKRLADGSWRLYYYHRASGVRLPDDPISIEFQKKLAELNNRPKEAATAQEGTIKGLIAAFKVDPDFTDLAAKTRKDYARYFRILEEVWGDLPAVGVRRKHVKGLRNKYAATPRTANYLVQVVRLLMTYAVDQEIREDNPASRPKMLKTGEGHLPWEEDEIATFRKRWAPVTVERVAFEMLLNLGQRGGDTIAMSRAHFRNSEASVKQEKTNARVWVPASDDLKAVLEPWLKTHDQLVLLVNGDGRPFKIDHFRHTMRSAYNRAGLPNVTTHGLRYTAATVLSELNCDLETIASITGHETTEMVRKYVKKRRHARLAIGRLNQARANSSGTDSANHAANHGQED
jgi:integrase